MSATDRTGIAQFTFPAGTPANILVPISHTLNFTAAASVQIVGDHQIEGYVEDRAFCGNKQTYKVYFVMDFSRPFAQFGTWNDPNARGPEAIEDGSRTATQSEPTKWIGAYAHLAVRGASANRHRKNRHLLRRSRRSQKQSEGRVRRQGFLRNPYATCIAAWNRALSTIEVSGGTAAERTVFYTALYHSLLMPSIFSDADGRYLGFDGKIHQVEQGHLIYANYSGWDIYRSEMPLLAMIEPRRMEDMAQSVVLMYQQGGWIDRWPQINLYTNVMAGSPLTVSLAAAWLDGLHGFDMKTAWEGMLKDATEAPPPGHPYKGEDGIDWINKVHYVPDDKVAYGSVSQIQEDADRLRVALPSRAGPGKNRRRQNAL